MLIRVMMRTTTTTIQRKGCNRRSIHCKLDPRVAIARGGIGEKGRNLRLVRRKLTSMTAEDFRWLNADFFIDIPRKADTPRKDKGKCIGAKVYIEREDGTIIKSGSFLPFGGGIPVFYPEIEHDYDYAIPWFFHHNRGIRKTEIEHQGNPTKYIFSFEKEMRGEE